MTPRRGDALQRTSRAGALQREFIKFAAAIKTRDAWDVVQKQVNSRIACCR